jgi:magnesium-transporting ATPase (P-type)
MAAGLRCVALAEADVSNGDDDIPLSASREELEADLRLMGVVALNAPLKVGHC